MITTLLAIFNVATCIALLVLTPVCHQPDIRRIAICSLLGLSIGTWAGGRGPRVHTAVVYLVVGVIGFSLALMAVGLGWLP